MDEDGIWTELDIAPTGDLAEIRRAYAARLKTIDVQADPHAFIALREAYDTARSGPAPDLLFGGEDWDFPVVATPAGHPEIDAIQALLYGTEPREAIFARLSEATQRLVDHAQHCALAESEAIELWVAETLASGIPRSNGMLRPAVTGFRWEERAEDHDCPYAMLIAINRLSDAEYLGELQRINPHYRRAWVALTEGTLDFSDIHVASMSTLLGIIQYQRPGLFEDVDTRHFERWIDYLEWQREARRRKEVLSSAEPVPEPNPIVEAIKDFACIGVGLALNLGAFLLLMRDSFGAFAILSIVGWVLIVIGRERRAKRKARGPVGKDVGRLS